ncbi:hypothetical protein E5347_04600 [Clostridium sartagoforme]|uniref:Uncharacterized protein n=1 Tax=Clostridium sartagoforme TaxID=84031 RepID=A0A4S2DSP2_9CLOT|nr:hypothetical protein [Clostridium sartagoforme]TGY44101.1 hypothetical protein E5347_04600 [Clostridium sartagoforme]
MSKDDYIYSYVERKLVDSRVKHTFDKERYKYEEVRKRNKSNLQGILIGAILGLIVVGIMIIIDLSK